MHATARLTLTGPFDGEGLASWFADRAISGVEHVEGTAWLRSTRLPHGPGVIGADLAAPAGVIDVSLDLADEHDAEAATALARRLLDLDPDGNRPGAPEVAIADPDAALAAAIPVLAPLIATRPGVRIPGSPSLAEALLWAITGQQITAAQARDQIQRATDLLSDPLPPALRIRRPGDPEAVIFRLPVDPLVAAEHADRWFRGPGARRRALMSAIPSLPAEPLPLAELSTALLALPGIGPWTADYALLRGVRAPDLAPPRDAALLAAARDLGLAADHAELMRALEAARPLRSLAVMHLWHHAAAIR